MMALGPMCMVALLFPTAAILGFFRGRARGKQGLQLQWPFYVFPIIATLVMGGAMAALLITRLGDLDSRHTLITLNYLAQFFGMIAVPYIGGGIAGFYLGKRKRDTEGAD